MPKALSTRAGALSARVASRPPYGGIFTGWHVPADGLRQVGRARRAVGEALRRPVRGRIRGRAVVLGDLERGEHGLLGRHARGVPAGCTTTRSTAVRRALPRRASAARTRPATAATFTRRLPRALPPRDQLTPPGRRARQSTSSRSTPRGRPVAIDGHVRMGIAAQLATIDRGFGIVASFPELQPHPDRDRRVRPRGLRRLPGAAARLPQRHVYSSYTAASVAREHDLAGPLRREPAKAPSPGPSSSRTSPTSRAFAPWRRTGSTLPVLNVFRMLSRMEGRRVCVVEHRRSASRRDPQRRGPRCARRVGARLGWRQAARRSWSGTTTTTTSRGQRRRCSSRQVASASGTARRA